MKKETVKERRRKREELKNKGSMVQLLNFEEGKREEERERKREDGKKKEDGRERKKREEEGLGYLTYSIGRKKEDEGLMRKRW